MKDIVIIVGTIVLACLIFDMICGEENSLKSAGSGLMEKTIQMYEESE